MKSRYGKSSGSSEKQCLEFDASYVSPAVSDRSHEHGGPPTSPQANEKKFREESPPATVVGRSPRNSEGPRPRLHARSPATAAGVFFDQFWADGQGREEGTRGLLDALGNYLA